MRYRVRNPKKSEMQELFTKFRKYGDVPPDEYRKVRRTSKRKQWLVVVDSDNTILGGGRTYKKDWYEWVVKNAFVIPSARGKGLANILYAKLTDKAEAEGAYVAEADITSTNIPSKMGAVYAGM